MQLPNVAEFYVVFFALLKAGIAPVNALFSHQKLELLAYAQQIQPRLLIASREHNLFRDDNFLAELRDVRPASTRCCWMAPMTHAACSSVWIPRWTAFS